MDDIDQPGFIKSRSRSPIMEANNRPPIATDESEEFDEVDRPASMPDHPLNLADKSSSMISPQEEILPSITVTTHETIPGAHSGTTDIVPGNDEPDEKPSLQDEMLSTIDNVEFETIDAPPTKQTSNTSSPSSSTDGPFSGSFTSTFFGKPSRVQHQSQRKDREGFITRHTTFYPNPLEKTQQQNAAAHEPSDSYYKMDHFPRGIFTLINVKYFRRSSGMADYPREGTDKDAEGLANLFLDLGFIVDRFDNPSKQEITAILKAAANRDYSKLSCSVCAMLSHGEEGIIYGNDDFVKIKDITKMFRTKTLAGKPKFFIFQACQGSEYMDPLDAVDGPGRGQLTEEEIALTLPSEADFLYAYSTVPGFYSWRNSRRGSWFVESLVKLFRDNAHKMDVLRMLVRVNDIVAYRKSRTDDYKTDNKRQISSLITQMRKDFFLCPPYGPLPKTN